MSHSIRTLTLGLIAIGLMFMDYHHYAINPVRASLTFLTEPIHDVAHAPMALYSWAKDSMSRHQQLVDDNTRLRAQHLLLQAQLQKMSALQSENKQLRAILNVTQHAATRMMVTQLIAVDPEPSEHIVVIDKGREQGVYLGQPVLDGSGIMGQIIQVGANTSRVLLLTDRRSAIPVQNVRTGLRALARGVGAPERLKLANVAETADIKRGDIFVSSGLGQRYPMGYPVAVVTRVTHEPNQAYAEVTMLAKAQLNRSRQLVLRWPETKD